MKKRISISIILSLILLLLTVGQVFAIDDPDSPPQVSAVYVYEFDDGSLGVFIDYYLDYTAPFPEEVVTDSYLAAFIDTDGTTQLKSVSPYTFVDSGYGRGIVWIKFTPDEVVTFVLDSANMALYDIWLVGNPTLAWTGDPPKTVTGIDQWHTTGDMSVILARLVLDYANILELIWSSDLITSTPLGPKLTATGEGYFENAISGLRTLAPACFSAGTLQPELEDIDYEISFGATATSGTSAVVGSPVTLATGANTITVNGAGIFTIDLNPGTFGTITDGTATIASSPSDIVPSENSITVTGGVLPGTLTVNVALNSTQEVINDTIEGTGFDMTAIATIFSMSRLMFSGLLWIIITIIICAAPYMLKRKEGMGVSGAATGGATMLIFAICLIGGTLLGMLDMRVVAMLAIGYGAFIGYILFFRSSADIGRTVMFMGWMWFVTCLVGGLLAGITPQVSTELTADITAVDTAITVDSTNGFREQGMLIIGDERVAYHNITADTFTGTFWRPLLRGAQDTEAVEHLEGASVRTVENSLLNDSLNYNIALLSDASGLMQFVSIPLVIWDIVTSFIFLPLSFLGTDMVILTYVWGIIGLGLLVSLFISLAGGRRMS